MKLKLKAILLTGIVILFLVLCFVIVIAVKCYIPAAKVLEEKEVKYLLMETSDDMNKCSDALAVDSALIDGGVIRVSLSKDYIKVIKLVGEEALGLDSIECLYRIISYVGVFGWELREKEDGVYFFVK